MQTSVSSGMTQTQSTKRRGRSAGLQSREALAGYAFILPALLTLTIFLILPILASAVLIFMEYDILSPAKWVGLANLKRLVSDNRMLLIYRNTLVFVVGPPSSITLAA